MKDIEKACDSVRLSSNWKTDSPNAGHFQSMKVMPEFSFGVDYAWQAAASEANYTQYEFIEPEHLFVGICKIGSLLHLKDWDDRKISHNAAAILKIEAESVVAVFQKTSHDRTALYREVRKRLGTGNYTDKGQRSISRSPSTRRIFERAWELAIYAKSVSSLHLLYAILETPKTRIAAALAETQPGAEPLKKMISAYISQASFPRQPSSASFLTQFGKDLTQLSRDGKIQPCIGRRDDLLQIIRTLSRESKNNPLLLGDAGVGKTAIVEGLAWRIAQHKDTALAGKRIVQINVADLVAGTSSRGDFEARMLGLVREVAAASDVILFIDEIHTLVGAGAGSSSLDAANILKPALARGELRCIGATTLAEYRKYIERDGALERRFQPISISESTADETVEILVSGYLKRFEAKHCVAILPEAIQAAVSLSIRFMRERRLPDKAVDVLDEACARIAVPILSAMPGDKSEAAVVTIDVVRQAVAEKTGIPLAQMDEGDRKRLGGMADDLKRRVVGQDQACEAVAQAVQRARVGLKAPNRPVAVLLFIGPTGVGKTELARATASFLFDGERAMVRIDMSEFTEKHTVSRLIGSPPGYVGHEEEGQLTGQLRRSPYCVVLLDEVEKAHPDVLDLFLHVFEDGRLTDAKGRTADSSNALFILTSNLGQSAAHRAIGFGSLTSAGQAHNQEEAVRGAFRPEFFNRLDAVIAFNTLSNNEMAKIADSMLGQIRDRLDAQRIELLVTPEAAAWICAQERDASLGARPLRRTIERSVENPLATMLVRAEINSGDRVVVRAEQNTLLFSVTQRSGI
jgi:ATP-dependent Clp protease ATP-binding subunit ClpC